MVGLSLNLEMDWSEDRAPTGTTLNARLVVLFAKQINFFLEFGRVYNTDYRIWKIIPVSGRVREEFLVAIGLG